MAKSAKSIFSHVPGTLFFSGKMGWDSVMGRVRRADVGGMVYQAKRVPDTLPPKVTYPDGSALHFTYDPNSSMLLSVTDSQGKLLESHTYDAQNRGLASARAYGVDSVSLSY